MASQEQVKATEPADAETDPIRKWQAEVSAERRKARLGRIETFARERPQSRLMALLGREPQSYRRVLEEGARRYDEGLFFLEHIGLWLEVEPEIASVVFELRQRWIEQHDLRTVPELLLVDQAMLGYFQVLRLHRESAKMLSLTQFQLYDESPWIKVKRDNRLGNTFDGLAAEDAVRKLQERLAPLMDRFNVMFLRNLKALRELKARPVSVNIGQAGQINVGQQQVNIYDRIWAAAAAAQREADQAKRGAGPGMTPAEPEVRARMADWHEREAEEAT